MQIVDMMLRAAEAGEDDMFLELPALLQAEIAQELTKDALAKSDILSVLVSIWQLAVFAVVGGGCQAGAFRWHGTR